MILLWNNQNSTMNHFSNGFLITMGIELVIQMTILGYSLYYIYKKVVVSDHVKTILKTEAVILITFCICQIIGFITITMFDIQNIWSCSLLFEPIPLSYLTIVFLMMILSIMKFKMSDLIGKNKKINDDKFRLRISLSILIIFFIIIIISSMSLNGYSITTIIPFCSGYEETYINRQLITFFIVSSLMITIHHDLKLVNFIKKYNKNNPDVMVVWTTGTAEKSTQKRKLEKQLENTVPRISTSLTIFMLVFDVIILVSMNFGFKDKLLIKEFFVILIPIAETLHLPLILTLTVWTHERRKRRQIIQLPTGLQLYSDDEESEIQTWIWVEPMD